MKAHEHSKHAVLAASLLALLFLALPGNAQEDKVMNPQDVTEAALVDALAPPAPTRTRSIRVEADGAAPKRPSASLLITFETNSARLTQQARQSLGVVGQALGSAKLAPFRFAIEGHADPRGAPAANQQLSQARAESVREYLVKNGGIDDGRLQAVGKGASELMNKTVPAAPENRRVTIVNLDR